MPEQVKVEKWQTEAAQEIRTLKPNYTDARDYAEVIARHYAAREREVQEHPWIKIETMRPTPHQNVWLVVAGDFTDPVIGYWNPRTDSFWWLGAETACSSEPYRITHWSALAPFTAQGERP